MISHFVSLEFPLFLVITNNGVIPDELITHRFCHFAAAIEPIRMRCRCWPLYKRNGKG
jgi:hypothetical protein